MQIFNTMTRQKEEFVPQKPGEYRIYVCGPTVYNYIHIGNARPMIVFDTLRRYLEYCGNKVYYVSNITDIDDKLIQKGQQEGISMQEVARKFEAEYIKDSQGLNVEEPTVRPGPPSTSGRSSRSSRTWWIPAMPMWPATATCISGSSLTPATAS